MSAPVLVVGYVRVSTETQLENYSIEEQTARLKAYCTAKGWKLLKTYTDGGYSGGNTDRPALRQMLADIRTSKVNAVVVYKLDRLSRSQKDTLTLIEDEFLHNGVNFVSINENFDTSTPFGRAMIGILSVFAQLEKDQIVERFTMGRIGRSKAGFYHGGSTIPLGYRYENGDLIVDDYKAMQVVEIFGKFLAGKSINAIMKDMTKTYGGRWSTQRILYVLKNSIYTGKIKFAKTEYAGRHAPIITEEMYDEAARLLSSDEREEGKNSAQKTPFRAQNLLSSLCYCARCGARYAGNHGYYKCYSRSKSSAKYITDPNCYNDNWEISALDARIVKAINDMLHDQGQIDEIVNAKSNAAALPDFEAMRKQLQALDKQIGRLIDLYQVGSIPMEDLSQRINELGREKSHLESVLAAGHDGGDQKGQFLRALTNFLDNFADAPLETQRLLISSIVKAIQLDGDTISISWRV